jgi:hypothetical protein
MDFLGKSSENGNRNVLMKMATRVTRNKAICVMCKLNKRKFLRKHLQNMSTARTTNYTKAKRKATCENEGRDFWGGWRKHNNLSETVFKT